jgi:hypothetical protein
METPSLGGWIVILKVFSRVPSDRGAPLFNLSQREAEGERSPSHAKSRQLKEKGHSAGRRRDRVTRLADEETGSLGWQTKRQGHSADVRG